MVAGTMAKTALRNTDLQLFRNSSAPRPWRATGSGTDGALGTVSRTSFPYTHTRAHACALHAYSVPSLPTVPQSERKQGISGARHDAELFQTVPQPFRGGLVGPASAGALGPYGPIGALVHRQGRVRRARPYEQPPGAVAPRRGRKEFHRGGGDDAGRARLLAYAGRGRRSLPGGERTAGMARRRKKKRQSPRGNRQPAQQGAPCKI